MTDNIVPFPSGNGISHGDFASIRAVLPAREGWNVETGQTDEGVTYIVVSEPRSAAPWLIEMEGGRFVILPPYDNGFTGPTLGDEPLPDRPRTAREAAEVIRREVFGVAA